jgi:hypothetical protein
MKPLFIFSFALSVAASVFAQIGSIAVDPPDPTSGDLVTVIVQHYGGGVLATDVTRNGFDIFITLHSFCCVGPPQLNGDFVHVDVGRLPAGTYSVHVTEGTQSGDSSFTVLDGSGVEVDQSIGSSSGGTPVNVIVAGIFCQGRPVTACAPPAITFGGVPATNVRVLDFSHFTAITPPHPTGAVQVSVSGDSVAKSAYAFRYYSDVQPPTPKFFDMVLVPVVLNAAGANGSNWVTELSMRNDNDFTVAPWHAIGGSAAIPPLQPFRFGGGMDDPYGIFLVVPQQASAGMNFRAIVRDTSRALTDIGTELPLVRASDFTSTRNLELLDIPVDARYRTMLRIYASQLDATGHDLVGVDIYSMDDGHDIRSFFLPLQWTTGCIDSVSCLDVPLYAAVADLTAGANAQRIGVRVGSRSGIPIWAFATITNNDTNHVTVVTPH